MYFVAGKLNEYELKSDNKKLYVEASMLFSIYEKNDRDYLLFNPQQMRVSLVLMTRLFPFLFADKV